ncbi:conserved hypothetical protein [Trichinella spiralis]|uniref:hypothetical protein n=1 Tax=Trichinella spiralis TaxID=6334 RepID=UPI0001EFCD67|nr:conserved hypothetical protein [Trichinella spiralis]
MTLGASGSLLVRDRLQHFGLIGGPLVQAKTHSQQPIMANFRRCVPLQGTTCISLLLRNPRLNIHLLDVGLRPHMETSELKEDFEQIYLQA